MKNAPLRQLAVEEVERAMGEAVASAMKAQSSEKGLGVPPAVDAPEGTEPRLVGATATASVFTVAGEAVVLVAVDATTAEAVTGEPATVQGATVEAEVGAAVSTEVVTVEAEPGEAAAKSEALVAEAVAEEAAATRPAAIETVAMTAVMPELTT
eukprot:4582675-Pleurochrysis_carterae.AAC.1